MSTGSGATATHEQVEMLLEFLQEHHDLAHGLLKTLEGRERSKRLWRTITDRLNSMGGAVKSVTQWQRVWADKKYLIKKTVAQRNKDATRTGGGPPSVPPPSQMELKVLAVMGQGFGEPQTSARTPAFMRDENEENLTPNIHRAPPRLTPPPIVEAQEVEEDGELFIHDDHNYGVWSAPHTAGTSRPSHTLSDTPALRPSISVRQQSSRSQRQPTELRGRLLDSEARKLEELVAIRTELSGIRAELAKLTELLSKK